MRLRLLLLPFLLLAGSVAHAAERYQFDQARDFLNTFCKGCHTGKNAAGGFHLDSVSDPEAMLDRAAKWTSLRNRVIQGEMPPRGAKAPSLDAKERFTAWIETELHQKVCASGPIAGPPVIRRLNRDEYAATIRDLLDVHLDLGAALPADGAGGEGFDNAAETLFLSPLHAEKYLDQAKFVMDFAAKEYKSRAMFLTVKPGPGVTEDEAARRILSKFLPRAFRRPVTAEETGQYLSLYRAARRQGEPFEQGILFALRGVLVSPNFLFRIESRNEGEKDAPLDGFSLASRISYFLWGSMPDEFLFDAAAAGKLHDPQVLRFAVGRMIENDRSLGFAQRFVEQWLRTRELTADKVPDPKLFPFYQADEELRSDIRLQPVLYFRELLVRNESLLGLIDSRFTVGTSNLEKHYGIKLPLDPGRRKQPQYVELPAGSDRGGLLGMAAVLTVSSYPYRTSPVLRGAWILDSILGTPPPPPPANVPPLEEPPPGAAPKSVRERLTKHRENAVCASCHSRIDPLGFALENYDPVGRWRTEDSGKPVDAEGELSDGTKFAGPAELKSVLLERKDLFLRNITAKALGFALGRGLTLEDSCTVDAIVAKLKQDNYRARTLMEEIVLSVPFRYQAGKSRQIHREAASD